MFLQNAARTYGTIVGEFLPTVLWVYPTHGTVGVYGIHPQYTPTEVRIPSVYTVYTLGISLAGYTVYPARLGSLPKAASSSCCGTTSCMP